MSAAQSGKETPFTLLRGDVEQLLSNARPSRLGASKWVVRREDIETLSLRLKWFGIFDLMTGSEEGGRGR